MILSENKNKEKIVSSEIDFEKQPCIKNNILSTIGNTPMVKIKNDKNLNIYAKLEYFNPGGSIKDRSALYMIEQEELSENLKPNGTIIEASSGNQALSVAMIGNVKNYNVIITLSETESIEKRKSIEAYGAKLILCPSKKNFFEEGHYYSTALKLSKEIKNSVFLNQYFNKNNAEAHYKMTGPEIYRQIGNKMTYIFLAVGSGGTINGVARYLKEKNKNIKVIGVYAKGSKLGQNGNPIPYNIDGMGINYDTPFLDFNFIDELICIDDDDTKLIARKVLREQGLFFGLAGAAVLAAILKYEKLTKNDEIVFLVTDSGKSYLSKNIF